MSYKSLIRIFFLLPITFSGEGNAFFYGIFKSEFSLPIFFAADQDSTTTFYKRTIEVDETNEDKLKVALSIISSDQQDNEIFQIELEEQNGQVTHIEYINSEGERNQCYSNPLRLGQNTLNTPKTIFLYSQEFERILNGQDLEKYRLIQLLDPIKTCRQVQGEQLGEQVTRHRVETSALVQAFHEASSVSDYPVDISKGIPLLTRALQLLLEAETIFKEKKPHEHPAFSLHKHPQGIVMVDVMSGAMSLYEADGHEYEAYKSSCNEMENVDESGCSYLMCSMGIFDRKSYNSWLTFNHPDKVINSKKAHHRELVSKTQKCIKNERRGVNIWAVMEHFHQYTFTQVPTVSLFPSNCALPFRYLCE